MVSRLFKSILINSTLLIPYDFNISLMINGQFGKVSGMD
ncbi:hypothetical protein JC2156_03990 [Weissella koreensis KCTC 3621]|nr:hypothetical protein JC2156_05030 [Weissella koreensis KCTC 3621]EJF34091.1 hypothetical protein JC2156_03990 [Weissella koreensis KCTC 3621]